MPGTHHYHYRLFGLRIGSEMELPELLVDQAGGEVDLSIRAAQLPAPGGRSDELIASGPDAGFFIEGVAHYQVSQGTQILVDAAPGASMRNVRLFLLGSAMGLALHQRGSLPLHASAIEIGSRGYAFMGPSGSGKSTLAAAFHDRGHKVIADDVCVISFGTDGRPVAHAGIPRLRLWDDALAATGRAADDYEPSFTGDDNYRKFDVPMPLDPSCSVALAGIVTLAAGDDVELEKLEGVDAIDAVFANTYRGGFIPVAGDAQAHWHACIKLVSAVPIFKLIRPWERASIERITRLFERSLG